MNTRRFTALAASTALLGTLAACGGSNGPTYNDVMKDHTKADKACQSALGSDQKTLALLDPGESTSSKFRVKGDPGDEILTCRVLGEDFHSEISFSHRDEGEGGQVTAHSGKLYSWADPDGNSNDGFIGSKVQKILNDATKKLVG